MYIVVCDNPEGEPDLLGPFDDSDKAQRFVDAQKHTSIHLCPNDHYWLEVIPIADESSNHWED